MKLFAKRAYLDWAAAAPVARPARRAYARALAAYGNPSSPHQEGRDARRALERARVAIARLLEMKADDIVFTSGATESNALAIAGVLRAAGPAPHALYLPSAHASVTETMRAQARAGAAVEPLSIKDGRVDIEALAARLRPETVLVSMDLICGETGTRWNVRDVRRALDEARSAPGAARIYLHVDASQASFVESLERTRLGADLITLDAQKAGGVRGIGVLAAPRAIALAPLMQGGGQERAVRPGTPSPAHAAAFAAALAAAHAGRAAFRARAAASRARLIARLAGEEGGSFVPGALVNEGADAAPHILNIALPGRDTDYLVALLDEAGFAVSTRSACETDSEDGSRAVFALTGDRERAAATLRISWGPGTAPRALDRFADALHRAAAFMDAPVR